MGSFVEFDENIWPGTDGMMRDVAERVCARSVEWRRRLNKCSNCYHLMSHHLDHQQLLLSFDRKLTNLPLPHKWSCQLGLFWFAFVQLWLFCQRFIWVFGTIEARWAAYSVILLRTRRKRNFSTRMRWVIRRILGSWKSFFNEILCNHCRNLSHSVISVRQPRSTISWFQENIYKMSSRWQSRTSRWVSENQVFIINIYAN